MSREDTQFKPGQSGNIRGRPPRQRCISDILRELTSKPHGDNTVLYEILKGVVDSALMGHRFSIEFICNYLEGKPVQVQRVVQETDKDIIILE